MDTIYRRCAGLDVHKETVQACVRVLDDSDRVRQETRRFGTTTRELLGLYDWLSGHGVTHVAMESTGVYWKPIWNILESGFELLLANARHIKNVPGRKTDVKDCQWIAQLMQCGLLKPSFVPRLQQRQWRDLTRHRVQIVAQVTQTANRIQKILEDANIKLSSVASDVLGVSGREMIGLMIQGVDDPTTLAACARRRLKSKTPQLREALNGKLTDHHRYMLELMMDQLGQLESLVQRIEDRLDESMKDCAAQIALLDGIPGVDKRTAQAILAEIGADMSHFPTDQALACWAGMCPGLNQSANKRRSGRTVAANRWLRRALVQAGWAASHTRNTYLSGQYHRLVGRRGRKRALLAVGHSILVSAYHMLKNKEPYHDLGPDHFQNRQPDRLIRQLVRRLQSLGQTVILAPAA